MLNKGEITLITFSNRSTGSLKPHIISGWDDTFADTGKSQMGSLVLDISDQKIPLTADTKILFWILVDVEAPLLPCFKREALVLFLVCENEKHDVFVNSAPSARSHLFSFPPTN